MQMGFAARSAVTAVELARRGMPGPRAPISGEFGYFALYEGAADPAPLDELGQSWRIAELSCKPFPSGRATHGGIDALQRLIAEEGVTAERVIGCRFRVPPLTARLIQRPITQSMTPNYARLCLQYVGAVCLRRGTVGLQDFAAEALTDPQTLALASRLQVVEDGNADPNALLPQRVEVDLTDGRTVAGSVDTVPGGPARLMPCAGSSRCAGTPSESCHSTKVQLCGTRYQLSKRSKTFECLRSYPAHRETANGKPGRGSTLCKKSERQEEDQRRTSPGPEPLITVV